MTARLLLAALTIALAGCALARHGATPTSNVHYVVGPPYQIASGWYYPREQFDDAETGLATPIVRNSGLTADGEIADPRAMAAAHATLQLPAIAKVTNLDTGRQVLVRINDRGPEQRGRAIALTPRVFELLGAARQASFRVRVEVQEAESRRLAADLTAGEQPILTIAAVPAGIVRSEQLALPPGAQQSTLGRTAPETPHAVAQAPVSAAPVPLRLPEQIWQVPPRPGSLYVEAGTFGHLQYAEMLREQLSSLNAQTSTSYDAPRDRAYRVRIGPLFSVADADATLARAVKLGIVDARIVAE